MASRQLPTEAAVATPAADNRIPGMADHGRSLLRGLASAAWLRLRDGRPAGHAQLSRPGDGGVRLVLGLGAALVLGSAALFAIGGTLAVLFALLLGVLALGALMVALALDRVVPPPLRPDLQAAHLPGRPDARHPFVPSFRETELLEYVPGSVWLAQQPLVFYGTQLGARMAVLRLDGDELLVYSPISLTAERRAAVSALGRVRWLVAPNLIHHMYLPEWLAAFPEADAWAAPGLPERRPDLHFAGVLEETETQAPWSGRGVRHAVVKGHAFHEEVVLLHERSRTLLVADLIEYLGHRADVDAANGSLRPRLARAVFELTGMCERPGPPTDWKLTVEDRDAVARETERVAGWDFERIVIAHGPLIEREARDVWRDAFAFAR